jgi:hypothetical protein
VGSYSTISPLPEGGLFSVPLSADRSAPPLTATLPYGARTFLFRVEAIARLTPASAIVSHRQPSGHHATRTARTDPLRAMVAFSELRMKNEELKKYCPDYLTIASKSV